MLNLDDYYCYIPLDDTVNTIKPEVIGSYPMHDIDASKCFKVGRAKFGANWDEFDVYRTNYDFYNKKNFTIDFILLPKKNTQKFEIEITDMTYGGYLVGKSPIIFDYSPQVVSMQHLLTMNELYKYISAGGNIVNKMMVGQFKFANIKTSDTKFVSL